MIRVTPLVRFYELEYEIDVKAFFELHLEFFLYFTDDADQVE